MTPTPYEALTQAAEICEGQARKQFRRHDYTAGCRDAADLILALRDSLPEDHPESAISQVPAQPDSVAQNEEQHPQPASADKLNPYWMIERGSPAEWWVRGSGRGDGTMLFEEWTRDASKAQHFNEWGARRHAQELESWGVKGPLRATEHLDMVSHQEPHIASGVDQRAERGETLVDLFAAEHYQEIRRKRALAQRLDASHDECLQREESAVQSVFMFAAREEQAVQRAQIAEAQLAKMRAQQNIQDRPAVESAVKRLIQRFEKASCDSDGVAQCVRCNVMFLARVMQDMLAASQPPAEREEKKS